ncbi:shock factor protein 4 [Seminavis robusta]|uniref:Shock factor protein 4 n=1 Tax=Seminavis robusta TaxID=568900 RepID=A0A9N8DND3_9STRA|nr:shock factor protein 4 [Seminavis robusta]|eukprot:Sro224_g091660.1 shock factor protein 4 (473) ;mRNA; f:61795-63213
MAAQGQAKLTIPSTSEIAGLSTSTKRPSSVLDKVKQRRGKGPKRNLLEEHLKHERQSHDLLYEMRALDAMDTAREQKAAAEHEAARKAAEQEAAKIAAEQATANRKAAELRAAEQRARARAAERDQQARTALLGAELEQQALERQAAAALDAELAQRANARAALDAELAQRMRARAALDVELAERVRARAMLDAELRQHAQASALLRRHSGGLDTLAVSAGGLGSAGIFNHHVLGGANPLISGTPSSAFSSQQPSFASQQTSFASQPSFASQQPSFAPGSIANLGLASSYGRILPTSLPGNPLAAASFHQGAGPIQGFPQAPDSTPVQSTTTRARAPTDEEDEDAFFAMIKGRSQKERFPIKLYRMIFEAKKEGREDVVSFLPPHGKAFGIHDEDTFVREIMPRYFGDCKLSSFQKQLNLYGFRKITVGKERGKLSYFHTCFLRGRPSMCHNIHRRCTTGGAAKKKGATETK